jgi:hypothetical protein
MGPYKKEIEMEDKEQFEKDKEQVETLKQSSSEDLAVDPNVEQPSQDPEVVIESDEGAEG